MKLAGRFPELNICKYILRGVVQKFSHIIDRHSGNRSAAIAVIICEGVMSCRPHEFSDVFNIIVTEQRTKHFHHNFLRQVLCVLRVSAALQSKTVNRL